MAFKAPAPAPPPPNLARTLPRFVAPTSIRTATHLALPVAGKPTMTLSHATAINLAAKAGTPSAVAFVENTNTAATSGNAAAIGNAQLLETAADLAVQMQYVAKFYGAAAAAQLQAGAHISTPVVQPAAMKRAVTAGAVRAS